MADINKLLDNSRVKVRFLKKDLQKVLDALNQIDFKLSEEGKNENGKEEKR